LSFTLAQLKAAIQDYTENTEDTFANQLDTFIKLAEEKINQAVRIQNFNTQTAPTSSSTKIVAAGSEPSSAFEITDNVEGPLSPIYFKVRACTGAGASEPANAWTFLLLKDNNFLQEYAPKDSVTGRPEYYSFYNTGTSLHAAIFIFRPVSDAIYDFEICYYFNPPSLVDVPTGYTTWLSTHGANALLYGSLVEAYTFMKGEADIIQMYASPSVTSVEMLRSMEGDSYREEVYRSPGKSAAPAAVVPQG
jgi:hypothetical protein